MRLKSCAPLHFCIQFLKPLNSVVLAFYYSGYDDVQHKEGLHTTLEIFGLGLWEALLNER
jgi:hypothetical protein